MPYIVNGSPNRKDLTDLRKKDLGYTYPQNMDLRPGSEMHNMIVDEVMMRANASHSVLSSRFDSWNKIDQVLTAYIPSDDKELKVKSADSRKPTSIIFPYTYAVKETLQTYAMSALVQDPIFQYEGVGPEDTIGAILLEKKVQLDCMKTKVPLALHTQFGDGISYGFGVSTPGWYTRRGTLYASRTQGKTSILGRLLGRQAEETIVSQREILFEGNKLENIDPYLCLPDPAVSIHKVQDGDFFGWIHPTTRIGLLGQEADNQDYFNVRYLEMLQNGLRTSITNSSDRGINTTQGQSAEISTRDLCDVIYMYINLIPREWKLGDGEYPEKWMFAVAGDSVVVMAKPLGLNHGMYPVSIMAPDYDGYQMAPISRLETLYGLQHVINWLFNSHITNVRKVINDMLIVDPWQINVKDLEDPEPGGIIRTRRPMWGKGVKDGIAQLNVQDVTRGNIADTSFIVNWMNHVGGVDEAMMGSLRQGGPERLTGAEFSGTRQSAMGRLTRMAMVMSMMGMHDIGYLFASHTQQLMSKETYVKATGKWEELLRKEYGQESQQIKVSPFDLLIDYDVVNRDGGIPGNQDTNAWLSVMKMIMENPEAATEFDLPRIFQHLVREMGAKNVQDFLKKTGPVSPPQVVPDEEVMAQVQAGNLKPIGA